MRAGEADVTISELCAGQATKIVWDGSTEPRRQRGHMKHKKKQNIETCSNWRMCMRVCVCV